MAAGQQSGLVCAALGLEKQGSLFLWIGSLTGFERVTILSSTKLSYCSCPMIKHMCPVRKLWLFLCHFLAPLIKPQREISIGNYVLREGSVLQNVQGRKERQPSATTLPATSSLYPVLPRRPQSNEPVLSRVREGHYERKQGRQAEDPATVQQKARLAVLRKGGNPGDRTQLLGQHVLQFGKFQVLYVDRDCCSQVPGRTGKAGRMFVSWSALHVRLDIWHFMRRLACGVNTESHPLYAPFMGAMSVAIFTWDEEDFDALKAAKRSQLQEQGVAEPSDGDIRRSITKQELALHCRRATRGDHPAAEQSD
ncbi:hypothetical protein ACOMHN_042703 [Nucella lapillus]